MNINDFNAPLAPESFREILELVFERQKELMAKYKLIEQLPDPPLSPHLASAQKIIRDFAWRTTEELAESYEAGFSGKHTEEVARVHCIEELADALHFFVEMLIFAGVTVDDCLAELNGVPTGRIDPTERSYAVEQSYWNVTYTIGLAMNFMRNKAWKTSHVPTDLPRFKAALLHAYVQMLYLWADLGCDQADLFAFYFRKSEVNKFRQRSAY